MSKSLAPGRGRPRSVFSVAVGAGVLALLAAACGSGQRSAAAGGHRSSRMPEMSSSMPMPSGSMSMGGGSLPMSAEHMHVAIVSPAAMTNVTGNSVAVQVRATGFTDTCALAGKHVGGMEATATGHYHVLLDGALVNMYCTPTAVVSLQHVKPRMHTLTIAPALDHH